MKIPTFRLRNPQARRNLFATLGDVVPAFTLRHAVKEVARISAPTFFMLAFAAAAHAQQSGSIDFAPVTNVATSAVTALKFVGGAMAVGGLIFSAFEWFGRHDASKAVGGLVGAIVGGVIIGAATTWGTSLSGQAVQ